MKYLLIASIVLLASCTEESPKVNPKFTAGDVLCAGEFKGAVVNYYSWRNTTGGRRGITYRFINTKGREIKINEPLLRRCEEL